MYAILSETKETIALKKKQIEENQQHVNQMAFEMADRVQKVMRLGQQVRELQDELYKLEKQVLSNEEQRRVSQNDGCCVAASPHTFTGNHLPQNHPHHP